jgi:hypothetical protein
MRPWSRRGSLNTRLLTGCDTREANDLSRRAQENRSSATRTLGDGQAREQDCLALAYRWTDDVKMLWESYPFVCHRGRLTDP